MVRMLLLSLAISALMACGGGSGASSTPPPSPAPSYSLSGRVQKGPFGIGSEITVNALDASLSPAGTVYNTQTSDALGNFSLSSKIATAQVEIVAQGFYFDEISGQLSAAQIQLRAISDISANPSPTVNVLTTLQEQRLKTLVSEGSTFAAADSQSAREVLALFEINAASVTPLSSLDSMRIDDNTTEDAVLLAVSVILSQMATDSAKANGTMEAAELSNLINTIAAGIASTGTYSSSTFITSRDLANTEVEPALVIANLQTYYANNGDTVTLPQFMEWVDQNNSGVLPQPLATITSWALVSNITSGSAPGNVYGYSFSTSNGILSQVAGSPFASGTAPYFIVADPSGQFAYVTNSNENTVSAYTISSMTGALTPIAGSPFATGGLPVGIAVDSTDSFVYVANCADATISAYSITKPTGALQQIAGSPFAVAGICPNVVSADPAGNFLYVETNGSNVVAGTVNGYSINSTTGALTPVVGSPFTVGANPAFITLNPAGTFAYVANVSPAGANSGVGTLSVYAVNPTTGSLTMTSASPVATGSAYPRSLAIDPKGRFLFVADSAGTTVSAFAIDSTTGAVAPVMGSPFASGSSPISIGVDPTGTFVFAVNSGSGNVSVFTVGATSGALSLVAGHPFAAGTNPTCIAIVPVH